MAKLRFKPGEFYREKSTKKLYIVIMAFKLKAEPNVWQFFLEERESTASPDTPYSLELERMSEKETKFKPVIHEPFCDVLAAISHDMNSGRFSHGSSKVVTNQRMINEFTLG